MTDEDHKPLLRRAARAFNTRNFKALDALFSPHFIVHDPRQPRWPRGLEGARQLWASLLNTAPDVQMTIEDLVSEGDKVVVRWTFQGTSTQPVQGQAPGKPFTTVSIAIYRIVNGMIEEEWGIAYPLSPTDTPWK